MISKAQVESGVSLLLSHCSDATKKAVFKRVEGTDYDPETGQVTTVEQTFTADVIQRRYKSSQVDGTNILFDDYKLLTKSSLCSFVPKKTDTVALDNQILSIISVESDAFGVAYIIQAR